MSPMPYIMVLDSVSVSLAPAIIAYNFVTALVRTPGPDGLG